MLDNKIVDQAKEYLLKELNNDILTSGDPREKVRFVNANLDDLFQLQCMKELVDGGYVEHIEENVWVVTDEYYNLIKGGVIKS